mgnify:CR=1 FL=1
MKKSVSVLLTVLLTAATAFLPAGMCSGAETSYNTYSDGIRISENEFEKEIAIDISHTRLSDGAKFNADGSLSFSDDEAWAEVLFNADEDTFGYLELTYIPSTDGSYINSSIGIEVNGAYPFNESRELSLYHRWKQGKRKKDKRGNETLSSPEVICEKTVALLSDPTGRLGEPLVFSFSKGENRLKITAHTGNFTLCKIRLTGARKTVGYKDYISDLGNIGDTESEKIVLEAEDYIEASDSTLSPDYDKSNAATSPNDPGVLVYNMISGDKYSASGQWLMWEFTPEKTGMYNIAFRARQNDKSGFSVTRRLLINDGLPFSECGEISFPFSKDWYIKTLGGEEAYSFYFEKGKTYQLKLEVTPGAFSDITVKADNIIYELNSLYRSVIMVAGTDPDNYRDYQLDKVITDFDDKIKGLITDLEKLLEEIKQKNGGKSGSMLSSLHSLINRLESVEKEPDLLAKSSSSFKSDIQSFSSWNQDAKEQPLDLDYIVIYSPNAEKPKANPGFVENLIYRIKRVAVSFTDDYGIVGDISDKDEALDVWLTTGREQMNIIKRLSDNSFSAESNIPVNISLVTVDIRTAVLSGTAPDVSLFLSSDMAVNLAIRGAVVDLIEMRGYSETTKNFSDNSVIPFTYKDGCYALPLSETFNMMFVRTDIFDDLGIKTPNTWEEFYQVATVLQRNNLEVGIPSNIGMFATLLFQYGGSFYNDGLTGTAFDSDASITAFKMWTGLFSRYGFPLTYDFYNRFSSGEMPLAIADYTQYLKVQAASPELSGRWEMTLIPGVKGGNGEIDRTLCISAATGADTSPGLAQSVTCGVIFSGSEKKEKAWEFLKWFTSDKVQTEYGRQVEAALGPISRYTPANKAAFANLAWSRDEKSLLNEQMGNIRYLNEISGNYSVTRELTNAFRRVVYDNANPTDTIYTYNKRINKELARKRENNK